MKKVAILNFGTLLPEALQVAEKYHYAVIDMRFVKPIDKECLAKIKDQYTLIVTLEENAIQGGAGSAVLEVLAELGGYMPQVLQLGLPDYFIPQGTQQEIYHLLKLDAEGIEEKIQEVLLKGK